MEVLWEHLDAAQRKSFPRGYFFVVVPNPRILPLLHQPTLKFEINTYNGNARLRKPRGGTSIGFCMSMQKYSVLPGSIGHPPGDSVLAQKLAIEANVKEWLAEAVADYRRGWRRGDPPLYNEDCDCDIVTTAHDIFGPLTRVRRGPRCRHCRHNELIRRTA